MQDLGECRCHPQKWLPRRMRREWDSAGWIKPWHHFAWWLPASRVRGCQAFEIKSRAWRQRGIGLVDSNVALLARGCAKSRGGFFRVRKDLTPRTRCMKQVRRTIRGTTAPAALPPSSGASEKHTTGARRTSHDSIHPILLSSPQSRPSYFHHH